MFPWLTSNSMYRPSCPGTQTPTCLCLMSAGATTPHSVFNSTFRALPQGKLTQRWIKGRDKMKIRQNVPSNVREAVLAVRATWTRVQILTGINQLCLVVQLSKDLLLCNESLMSVVSAQYLNHTRCSVLQRWFSAAHQTVVGTDPWSVLMCVEMYSQAGTIQGTSSTGVACSPCLSCLPLESLYPCLGWDWNSHLLYCCLSTGQTLLPFSQSEFTGCALQDHCFKRLDLLFLSPNTR